MSAKHTFHIQLKHTMTGKVYNLTAFVASPCDAMAEAHKAAQANLKLEHDQYKITGLHRDCMAPYDLPENAHNPDLSYGKARLSAPLTMDLPMETEPGRLSHSPIFYPADVQSSANTLFP